jgi:hypothetical protein
LYTVTAKVPSFEESSLLVAVIVTMPEVARALKSPDWLMAPALADQTTAEL